MKGVADKAKKDIPALVSDITNDLLSLMSTGAKAKVQEEEGIVKVEIETEDKTGLLIGKHGETLNSLQSLIGLIIRQKVGDWVRVVVDVGDWRARHEDYLKQLAKDTAKKAKETGEAQPLYNLTPAQRRIVHLALSEDPEVSTESTGEEEERYLIVKPKVK